MMTTFDTDGILYSTLFNSPMKNAISGGIYLSDDRPEDSNDEDIVINSIDLTQDFLPQIGTSNINIYVSDVPKTIKGHNTMVANRVRLKSMSTKAMDVIRSARITGLSMVLGAQTILAEPKVRQHYVNIRIDWNILI